MKEIVKQIKDVSTWIINNPRQGSTFVLIVFVLVLAYELKKTSDFGDKMFNNNIELRSDLKECNEELNTTRANELKEFQQFTSQAMHEKDSLIQILQQKIYDANQTIKYNKTTIKKVKQKI